MCSHVDRLHVPASTVLWKIKPSVQVKHNSMRSNFLLPLKNSLCSPAFSLRSDPHERSLVVKKMGEMFTEKKNEDKRIPHDLIFSVKGFAQDGAFRPKLQTPENRSHKTDVPLHGTAPNKSFTLGICLFPNANSALKCSEEKPQARDGAHCAQAARQRRLMRHMAAWP